PNQRQDHRAFALGARRTGVLGAGGLGGLFADFGFLLGRGVGFAFGGFVAFWRALLLAGTLLRGGPLRRNCRALFRNGGGVLGSSSFCVRHAGGSFLRLVGA